jgi:hypothetical protein
LAGVRREDVGPALSAARTTGRACSTAADPNRRETNIYYITNGRLDEAVKRLKNSENETIRQNVLFDNSNFFYYPASHQ